jgi:hypothetical protein
MKYKDDIIKVLQLDGLGKVNPGEDTVRKLALRPEPYKPVNGKLPIVLLWKFQVSKNDIELLRLSAEDRYILAFSKDNIFPLAEAKYLITHSYSKLCKLWDRLVLDSEVDGTKLPRLKNEDMAEMARQIILLAGELELFN